MNHLIIILIVKHFLNCPLHSQRADRMKQDINIGLTGFMFWVFSFTFDVARSTSIFWLFVLQPVQRVFGFQRRSVGWKIGYGLWSTIGYLSSPTQEIKLESSYSTSNSPPNVSVLLLPFANLSEHYSMLRRQLL